jgi:hypothetical protein
VGRTDDDHDCCEQAIAQACAVCSPRSRSMSAMAMFQQESPGNPESHCLLAPEDSLARLELSFTFRPVCRLNSAIRCSPAPLPT